jgi:hypothetical protein
VAGAADEPSFLGEAKRGFIRENHHLFPPDGHITEVEYGTGGAARDPACRGSQPVGLHAPSVCCLRKEELAGSRSGASKRLSGVGQ